MNAWKRPGRDDPRSGLALADRPSAFAVQYAFGPGRRADGQLRLFGPFNEAIAAAGFDALRPADRTGHRRVLCRRRLHEFAGPNLVIDNQGRRRCRACARARRRGLLADEIPDEARAGLRCAHCSFDPAAPGRLLCDHCAAATDRPRAR